jgi:exo-1,4-beta-D-glucosaminidase
VSAPANASTQVLTLPTVAGLSTTYFIRLQLRDSSGALVSNNLYWYSTTADVLSGHASWYRTTVKSYANFTGLNALASNSNVTAGVSRTV